MTLLALAVASVTLTVPGPAAARSVPPPPDASPVMDPKRTVDYWTKSKQSEADAPEHTSGGAERRLTVPEGSRLTPDGDANGYGRMPRPYSAAAASRITGRLFFVDADGGRRSCSGSVVRSAGGLLVATAAHCVYGVSRQTGQGTWSSNIAFVPAYDGHGQSANETAPYGVWGARRAWKPQPFTGAQPWNWDSVYDLALVEVGRSGGATLQDTVGAFTPMRNQGGDYTITSLGYPSDLPYDGTRQLWCLGRTTVAPGYAQPAGQTAGRLHTVNCHLFGGNSGGPWLDRSSGMLVGVLSSGAENASPDGYTVANPLGPGSYGALVRQADPGGVYDSLSVKGAGSARRLTATVRMRGLMAAARVPVTFGLPRGVRPAPGTPCAVVRRKVTCTIAVVAPGRPERVSIPIRGAAARARFTVSVAATFLDPDPRDNTHAFSTAPGR
ncbi:trypsin-like serine peptidase [Nonomuraea sp. LPB2021202275-12-8]|uniref:trypsin-like serine peptidase n=1 Tax=Nonomuraea sp. LPB2021202275-12-8 TaxID=3120159 RepID=UPI00300D5D5D